MKYKKSVGISLVITITYLIVGYLWLTFDVPEDLHQVSLGIYTFLSFLFFPAILVFGIGIRGSSFFISLIIFTILWVINYGLLHAYLSIKNDKKRKKPVA